jgi:hypothetical protein
MGASIAVLIPSRNRPDSLFTTVSSIFDKAFSRKRMQVLIWTDEDDLPTQRICKEMKKKFVFNTGAYPNFDYFVMPRPGSIQETWNFLYKQTTALVLGMCADDCTFISNDWDKTVFAAITQRPFHIGQTHGKDSKYAYPGFGSVPFVSRPLVNALGYLAKTTAPDLWLVSCCVKANVSTWLGEDMRIINRMVRDDINEELIRQRKLEKVAGMHPDECPDVIATEALKIRNGIQLAAEAAQRAQQGK